MNMEEQKHNKDGMNLNIQRTEMAQFTGMARVQMFVDTVLALLRMVLAVIMVGGLVGFLGYIGYTAYTENQAKTAQIKPKK
jgi:hypothetical protein